ncbi:hypothetical protein F5Y15DRAFT_413132 [Xylariaceae sp. FL0016]|nr:hypothetical protein F5Y15DRAFT_413132 [Xylariaceae sp. FL0016]
MTSALRLTAWAHAIGLVHGRWSGSEPAENWGPAIQTADAAAFDPLGWTPKPTPAPGSRPHDSDLEKRDDSKESTCGFPVDDLSSPAVTCQDQAYCMLDRYDGVVGCCTGQSPRDCTLPTTCLESTNSALWSGDPLTIYCSDPDRPHCVTYSYDANFYDDLYGASFIGCATERGTGVIATTPAAGWDPPGGNSTSSIDSSSGQTASPATTAVTITVAPGSDSSSSASPASSSGNSTNVGAIVGGTVGGVAGLALIIAGVFFFLRRRKRRQSQKQTSPMAGDLPTADMYGNVPPGSAYPSTFYGEAPPGMAQTTDQHFLGYTANGYGDSTAVFARDDRSSGAPSFFSPGIVKQQDEIVSPIEPSPISPVSPVSHDDNYNTMVSALTNPTPPPPAQSHYNQYSPPPPQQYQSYQPYPGT